MSKTTIEWTRAEDGSAGHTWNPLSGCTPKSPGCLNCYAALMSDRLDAMGQEKYRGLTVLNNGHRMFNGVIRFDDAALKIPLSRKKPTTYFVNSMSDLFWGDEDDLTTARRLGTESPEPVPFDFIDKVFAVMALCPHHKFQVLTKRPARMAEYLARTGNSITFLDAAARSLGYTVRFEFEGKNIGLVRWPLPNVWCACSCEDKKTADERIIRLLKCPAAVRFISAEPLLGPIDLMNLHLGNGGKLHSLGGTVTFNNPPDGSCGPSLDWVIVGGESGPGARPCNIDWIRSIVAQCKAANVACFVKQLGANVVDHNTTSAAHFEPHECWPDGTKTNHHRVLLVNKKGGDKSEWPEDLRVRQMPGVKVGMGIMDRTPAISQ